MPRGHRQTHLLHLHRQVLLLNLTLKSVEEGRLIQTYIEYVVLDELLCESGSTLVKVSTISETLYKCSGNTLNIDTVVLPETLVLDRYK